MAFGRFQPPTTGHELLVNAVKRVAQSQSADHIIFASRSEDKKSNPLPVDRKVYYLKRMFPKTNFVAANDKIRTFMEAAAELSKKYKHLVMLAGSDRVQEYKRLLEKYNGDVFNFETIEVVSAGERDPDADSASGMSGTKMREAAKKGDYQLFKKGLPHTLTDLDGKRLMNEIRHGMGLDTIKEQIKFETSSVREMYRDGKIFNIGDKVTDGESMFEVVDRGANYITVVNESGDISKKWLDSVQPTHVEEDVKPGYAPEEISFKGYTTKNLHHSEDATKAFQETINRYNEGKIKDAIAILNALKATDTYMAVNDLHLLQQKAPTSQEVAKWHEAHDKARDSLNRIGEFMHHFDYWHNHEHEIQDLETKYNADVPAVEMQDSYELEGQLTEMKFTSADKIKVARIIADALGVEDVDKSSSPEQLVNAGLRKVRSKPMRPEYTQVLHKMLQTADEAGIKWDRNLHKMDIAEETINELKKDTLKSYISKAMGSKSGADFMRGVKMAQGSGGEEELRKKSEKRSAGIHTAIKKLTKEELQLDEMQQGKEYTHKQLLAKVKSGNWEAQTDIKPGKHVEMRHHTGKRVTVKVSHEPVKEEVELEEGKMGQLSADIGAHIDKHVDRYKSEGGAEHLMSKIDHTAKKIASQHGLEHKHAQKFVSDYVEKKLHEEVELTEWVVKHDGVRADHPDYAIKKLFHGKKDVINHLTKYKDSAEKRAEFLKKKGYQNVRIEEAKRISPESIARVFGRPGQFSAIKKTPWNKIMSQQDDLAAKLKRDKEERDAKLNRESYEEISNLLEQLATAKIIGKPTDELQRRLSLARSVSAGKPEEHQIAGDVKNNESDVEADIPKPKGSQIGHSMVSPEESPAARKMKIKYVHEATDDAEKLAKETEKANLVAKQAKEKQALATKQQQERERLKEESTTEDDMEEFNTQDIGSGLTSTADIKTPKGARPGYVKEEEDNEDEELENLSDEDLDKMADEVEDEDDILDAYDDEELALVDDETGEHIEDIKEEVINEVLSRTERMKAKARFARTKSKRERKVKIALKSRSSSETINKRARRLAIQLMKKRLARKPLNTLSVGEKERLEKVISKRKTLVNRLAMKLAPKVRRIESDRLTHKSYTK